MTVTGYLMKPCYLYDSKQLNFRFSETRCNGIDIGPHRGVEINPDSVVGWLKQRKTKAQLL